MRLYWAQMLSRAASDKNCCATCTPRDRFRPFTNGLEQLPRRRQRPWEIAYRARQMSGLLPRRGSDGCGMRQAEEPPTKSGMRGCDRAAIGDCEPAWNLGKVLHTRVRHPNSATTHIVSERKPAGCFVFPSAIGLTPLAIVAFSALAELAGSRGKDPQKRPSGRTIRYHAPSSVSRPSSALILTLPKK
jgi:hypothetical protein